MFTHTRLLTGLVMVGSLMATTATAQERSACQGLPSHQELRDALSAAQGQPNGGFSLEMWATVVNRDGVVCAVVFTGQSRGDQWPGSRVISAQKANTANAFSLPQLALSTANLYSAVQPGGSLFGLQESNPVNVAAAYKGPSQNFGTSNDPLVGEKVGGVNVFGGGLGLFGEGKKLVGGIGLSGDTSCADHYIAWRLRNLLELDHLAGIFGVADAAHPDNIIFDIVPNPAGGTG